MRGAGWAWRRYCRPIRRHRRRGPRPGTGSLSAECVREQRIALRAAERAATRPVGTDGQTLRPAAFAGSFYNTQGRKVLVGALAATTSWIGSLYIPASWATPSASHGSGSRRSDLWATLWPASGGDTCARAACDVFPIIGFSNAVSPDSNNAVGGTPRFRVFDGANGGRVDLTTAVIDDAWTDFCVTFTGTAVEYRIGGQLVYTASDLAQSDTSFGPVTQVNDVILQAYNYGYAYDTSWSHLAAGSGSCADLEALFAPPTPTATATATATGTATPTQTATPASQGDSCVDVSQCAAGLFCSDSVCCDRACVGPGQSCDVRGQAGTCVTAPAAAPAASNGALLGMLATLIVTASLALRRRQRALARRVTTR